MPRISLSGRVSPTLIASLAVLAVSSLAYAQQGRITGTVVDIDEQPVVGADVTMEVLEGGRTRNLATTTDDRGRFVQVGLEGGLYRVTVDKEGVGTHVAEVRISRGLPQVMEIMLLSAEMAAYAGASEEERERLLSEAASKGASAQGLALSSAGDYDGAIAKFTEAVESEPDCTNCYVNMGIVYIEMEDYTRAVAAFKQALELDSDQSDQASAAAAYQGLGEAYTGQRNFDEAAAAYEQAAQLSGGGTGDASAEADATAVFNQGLALWNAGRLEEASNKFTETLELDPSFAEAHYWLGMAALNEGRIPDAAAEFQRYLESEPNGRLAGQATGILGQIQP